MTGVAAIGRLQRVADALAAGLVPEAEDATAHAAALQSYLAGSDLAAALGLTCGPGQEDARLALRRQRRDGYVRTAAEFWPVAEDLHLALSRYAASGWSRERHLADCPSHRIGTPLEVLWRILHEIDRVISSRQIREILRR